MKISFVNMAAVVVLMLSCVMGGAEAWTWTTSTTSGSTLTTRQWQLSAAASTSSSSSSSSTTTEVTLDGETIRGPITPLGNFCLVKTKDTLTATGGGILLPDQAKERPTEGQVIAAGPGKLHPHTGVRIPNPISVGDSVLYGKFDGVSLQYNDDNCQMIRDDDIMLYYTGVTMALDTVTPCRDYVLVAQEADAMETKSGIVVAAAVMRDQLPCEGIVVKIGTGRMASNGQFTPSPVQPGDRVKFKDYAGNDVRIENKSYSLVRMVDILASIPADTVAVVATEE